MYSDRVSAVKSNGLIKLIILPLFLALVVMNVVFPLVTQLLGTLIFPFTTELITPISVFSFAGSLILSILLAVLVGKFSLKDLGLGKESLVKKSLVGAFFGFLAISLVALVINLLGGVTTVVTFEPEFLGFIILGLVMFSFQSMFEEFVYRGYLMPHFSKMFGDFWAIMLTAILFVVLHALNPGMKAIPIVNLFLAGVVFSLVYYLWGSLWICGFAHALWNFSQGVIYGSLVSGNTLSKAVMQATPVEGMDTVSGADFGFEGSVITSILGIILSVLFVIYAKKIGIPLKPKFSR